MTGLIRRARWLSVVAVTGLLGACGSAAGTTASHSGLGPAQTAPASPGPSETAGPTATATPPAALPAGFSCADSSGHVDGGGPIQARITSVAAAAHPDMGFDRFVIRLDGSPSMVSVSLQENASFTSDAQGGAVTVEGSAGARVVLRGVDVASYTGPKDLRPEGTVLREARQIGAFEGQVTWALGLSRPACIRVVEPFIGHMLVVDLAAR